MALMRHSPPVALVESLLWLVRSRKDTRGQFAVCCIMMTVSISSPRVVMIGDGATDMEASPPAVSLCTLYLILSMS